MFVAIASPRSAVANLVASTKEVACKPTAPVISASIVWDGAFQSALRVKSDVGMSAAFATTRVRPAAMRASDSRPAVTTRSQPITASAEAMPIRGE